MEHLLIAVDVDGTLYDGAGVAPEAVDTLRACRAAGHLLVIVTGRRWESLPDVVPSVLELCQFVVSEEGGVLTDVATGRSVLLADPLDTDLVDALRAAGVDRLDIGRVTVGAPIEFRDTVIAVHHRLGSTCAIIVNKGSVALAPVGCDKASGLRAAVTALDAQRLSIVAIGDAANDLPMLRMATFPYGVANADDAVRASRVHLTTGAVGLGVAEALRRHLPT
jgi:hydroxymethylpyrimidine pyrophosphatase-like HAD family hydrolase